MHLDHCPHTIFENNPGLLSCTQADDPIFDLHSAISNKDGPGFEFLGLNLSEGEKESLSALTMNTHQRKFSDRGARLSFESIYNFTHDRSETGYDGIIRNYINCKNNCTDLKNIIIESAKIAIRAMGCNDTKVLIEATNTSSINIGKFHFDGYGYVYGDKERLSHHFVVFNLIGEDTTIF